MAAISSIATPQLPALSQGLDTPSRRDTPEKIEHAAKQFESLLIGQMLKSMHESGNKGWLGEEDESSDCAMEMAQEQFAQAIANGGGLGLSRMIMQSLDKSAAQEAQTHDPAAIASHPKP